MGKRRPRGRRGNEAGDKNAYWCERCGLHTVTVNRDPGVTPMWLGCRANGYEPGEEGACGGRAQSLMFPDPWPEDVPEEAAWEWFRPKPETISEMDPVGWQHFSQGGLGIASVGTGEGDPNADPSDVVRVARRIRERREAEENRRLMREEFPLDRREPLPPVHGQPEGYGWGAEARVYVPKTLAVVANPERRGDVDYCGVWFEGGAYEMEVELFRLLFREPDEVEYRNAAWVHEAYDAAEEVRGILGDEDRQEYDEGDPEP